MNGERVQTTATESPREAESHYLTYGQLAVVTAGRLALNTAYRVLYPLLPFLAPHFDVSLQTASILVTVLVGCGLLSPIGGALADTRGARWTMRLALSTFCVGAVVCALAANFYIFLAGYVLLGFSSALYLPAAQSYLSARTPYARRGFTLGIFEISWAAAALVGVAPLMQLVQATDAISPVYWALVVPGIVTLLLIMRTLPAGHTAASKSASTKR